MTIMDVADHDMRLSGIGETVRGVVGRIVATWERATAADVVAGEQWYRNGRQIIDDLSRETGHGPEVVAAVIAHLSPRTTWARNIEAARSVLTVGSAPGCLAANIDRAMAALTAPDPLATLNGPKTARFARNLLGDHEVVTVDVWAARVALGDNGEGMLGRVGVYAAVEHAYQLAARQVGVEPAIMQATTWVVARGGRAH